MKCPQCHFENTEGTSFCENCAAPLLPSQPVQPTHPADHDKPSDKKSGDITTTSTETISISSIELTTGTTFAERYQVIERLGKGGMGNIYKVFDTEIKEKIALKLLKPEVAAESRTIERFRNELKYARNIGHRNVCRMFDFNKREGTYYITMEYVPGEDLKSFIRRSGQLTVTKAVSLSKQVCEGLSEAHRLGVVHRDLKPGNIMIDKEGNARIMDFGIARSLQAKGITIEGMMVGTPEYMSPEQVETEEVDQRSDIYSLGIIMFEMLTGKLPFAGDTPISVAIKHKRETPPDPRKFNSQIPDDLSKIILKCMKKDKEKRYQKTDELISELSILEKSLPTTETAIPKRRIPTPKDLTVTFRQKNLFIPALVLIAATIFVIIIWRLILRKEAVPIPTGKPTLAVLYFKNNTGDVNLDHWKMALSDLLITDLSQSTHIRVLSGERLFNILEQLNQLEATTYSSDVLSEVAARGGVDSILVGNYTKAGDIFRINITLQDANTGELIGSESVEGEGEKSFYPMVDELTKIIKANFRFPEEVIASDIDRDVGIITTNFPEALRYYAEGLEYLRRADYRQALQFFLRAVAVDSEFAMAFSAIATTYGNLGYDADEREYLRKAFELSDRVSERELYVIQSEFYRSREITYDKAIETFKKLLALYPEHPDANNRLGLLYKSLEDWDKAVEYFNVCIQNRTDNFFYYVNIAETYMAMGLYDKAREAVELYLNNFPDAAWVHGNLAINYLCQEQYDSAHVEVDKAYELDQSHFHAFWIKGDIFHSQGNFSAAEREYNKLLEEEEEVARLYGRDGLGALYVSRGRFKESIAQAEQGIELAESINETGWKSWFSSGFAYMHLKSGNPEEALRVCDRALSSDVGGKRLDLQRRTLFFKGLAYLAMGSVDDAQEAADDFRELVERGMNPKEIRFYHHLVGRIELERGNFLRAIESFNNAISLLPHQYYRHPWIVGNDQALFIDSLASAYFRAGNVERALEEYEKIISLTVGRIHYGDIYAKSFYMLGKIYEQQGLRDRAIERYTRFLELWTNADPGIPEVTHAERQLANLRK